MDSFKLVTWNVNSIRIRLDLLKKLVSTYDPDIVCLQEVKAKQEDFRKKTYAVPRFGTT